MSNTNLTLIPPSPSLPGQVLTPDLIDEFITYLECLGRAEDTVSRYRRCLLALYQYLPETKEIVDGTLHCWSEYLLGSGFSAKTASVYCSAANSLLEYCQREDMQIGLCKDYEKQQPEITRSEYIQLLRYAKITGNDNSYMLVKTFGNLDIPASALPSLTVEAVKSFQVLVPNKPTPIFIPSSLQAELLAYTRQQGIHTGAVFRTSAYTPIGRRIAWKMIHDLGVGAHLPEEKCNPRCLSQMCVRTHEAIRRKLDLLEDDMYCQIMDNEQITIYKGIPMEERKIAYE